VQSHGAGQGFLVAAIFGIVGIVTAVVMITVKKRDLSQVSEAVVVA